MKYIERSIILSGGHIPYGGSNVLGGYSKFALTIAVGAVCTLAAARAHAGVLFTTSSDFTSAGVPVGSNTNTVAPSTATTPTVQPSMVLETIPVTAAEPFSPVRQAIADSCNDRERRRLQIRHTRFRLRRSLQSRLHVRYRPRLRRRLSAPAFTSGFSTSRRFQRHSPDADFAASPGQQGLFRRILLSELGVNLICPTPPMASSNTFFPTTTHSPLQHRGSHPRP